MLIIQIQCEDAKGQIHLYLLKGENIVYLPFDKTDTTSNARMNSLRNLKRQRIRNQKYGGGLASPIKPFPVG